MDLKLVGSRIRAAREANHLTQEELAEAVEMSPMHISVIERGLKAPKVDTFVKIANALHISADFLLQDVLECSVETQSNPLYEEIRTLPKNAQQWIMETIRSYRKVHYPEIK